uniref:Uncharacterized protein n=1 Tax=Arundo donax TaxID=35708 RepID=A0A0A9B0R2_ARUDO
MHGASWCYLVCQQLRGVQH